ncbi:MAG: PIN domain-containing protein [Actinobacteria bacterium]|nr:PIN domain-containing protein [Actinomycetota bacterium]
MISPVFLDTNVLVYLFANEDPERQELAERLYVQTAADGSTVLSTQVLQEFYSVATRTMRTVIEPATARLALQEFMEHQVVQVTPRMVLLAASRSASRQVSISDALIVEAALAGGCRTLYSEDFQHGRAFGPLRVVDPFRAD